MSGTGRSENARLAFVQSHDLACRNAAFGKRAGEIRPRFIDRLGGEAERAEMHPDALLGAEVAVRADGLRWGHVHVFHEPARRVAADAEHRDIGDAQPGLDGGEMTRISSVAAE